MGGNKGRKLEYLIADALAKGADTVVTCGAAQSNFIRQLGAACSMHDLKCVAVAMALPYISLDQKPASAPQSASGNVQLDNILGVDLRIIPDGTWDELSHATAATSEQLTREGRKVYDVPLGGSSALGAYAFFQAGLELQSQTAVAFDWIVVASSSGSTQTGLAYCFHGSSTKVLGIACDPEPELVDDYEVLYKSLEELAGPKGRQDWLLNLNFVGPGYGVPSEAGDLAITEVARKEGIFLDPIYTGKAFAGLLSLARNRKLAGRVLFWHTGGLPALFAAPILNAWIELQAR
jgi:1-aminocyclopropane-1-carboxylate deaminase/D-cysteine desulfhydrase-like pyridoxal-dependent ACC family enzyme